MKVFCTGISGCDKEEYLEEVVEFAKQQGKNIEFYSIGKVMREFCEHAGNKYDWDRILNVPPRERALAVLGAFERIPETESDLVISSHARFYWKYKFEPSKNHLFLSMVNPDLFVTIIDAGEGIKRRLDKKTQFKDKKFSLDEILKWQNAEVIATEEWADFSGKKHYVAARGEPAQLIYKLIYCPKVEKVYASFPMTHVDDEETKKDIQDFVLQLRKYFAVFNPASTELGMKLTDTASGQTVYRDLEWYITKNSDRIVIYLPEKVASAGVIREMGRSLESTKGTWLIAPKGIYEGPFERMSVDKRFYSRKEFSEFLEKKHKKLAL